jgi:crotonobetainyl-CoA:carnitine CoA-transferase CaiB-like acyl-CoA transferase
VAAVREEHWPALCRAIEHNELLDDSRFGTPDSRLTHRAELTAILEDAFMADLATNWRRRLQAVGVPAEVSVDTWDGETVLLDQELERLGLITEYDHPILGRMRQFGNLVTFSDTPEGPRRPPPMLGEHTREILSELGYEDAAIDAYRARGVVTWPDPAYSFPV